MISDAEKIVCSVRNRLTVLEIALEGLAEKDRTCFPDVEESRSNFYGMLQIVEDANADLDKWLGEYANLFDHEEDNKPKKQEKEGGVRAKMADIGPKDERKRDK